MSSGNIKGLQFGRRRAGCAEAVQVHNMKGQMNWFHLGLCFVYISFARSTPIPIHQSDEPVLVDVSSYFHKQEYPRTKNEILEDSEDRGIYQIIIPKKGHSLMYDDGALNKREEIDPDEVLSLLRAPSNRHQYDYYLPELYTEDDDEEGPHLSDDLIVTKEGAVKRLDDVSKAKDKKDLESLLYQANPALTVQKLPIDPQIDFRKFDQNQHKSYLDDKGDEEGESLKKSLQKELRGMEEVIQPRPSIRRDRTIRDRQSLEPPTLG